MKLILSGIVSVVLLASSFAAAQSHRHHKAPPPPLTPPGNSIIPPAPKLHAKVQHRHKPAHHVVRRHRRVLHLASHPLPRYNAKKHMWWIPTWVDSKGHRHAGHWTKHKPK